ncbi:hypothetical protein [Paraburkholderia humisilvae]|uniref:Uncharacterized protein n=1 Tax=Paraburkholderia humisilvae TaxID=627669 RepID=A0A6J5F6J0_9BURK|nr:hypothetical protein [Paraburkholderia humisilvae]CAB3774488.1 hypothetical protein LMG29542_07865 [Paraburkholderia humisilvae]
MATTYFDLTADLQDLFIRIQNMCHLAQQQGAQGNPATGDQTASWIEGFEAGGDPDTVGKLAGYLQEYFANNFH